MIIEGNKPITESANIIRYMDDNFEGTKKLLPRDDSKLMDKYNEFHDCHEEWNVGAYTFGHFMK